VFPQFFKHEILHGLIAIFIPPVARMNEQRARCGPRTCFTILANRCCLSSQIKKLHIHNIWRFTLMFEPAYRAATDAP